MTINLISDLHAIYDSKAKKVHYCLPLKYAEKKYLAAIMQLYSFWSKNSELLEKLDYSDTLQFITNDKLPQASKYENILAILDSFNKYAQAGFQNLDLTTLFDFSRSLHKIDHIMKENRIVWSQHKTKLNIRYDIVKFLFKKMGDFDPSRLEPADYLIIAGDLGTDNTYDFILNDIEEKTKGKFKKILHIAGNHDHWWIVDKIMQKRPNVANFSRDYYEWQDNKYLFLGCTLWTPIPDNAIWRIMRNMNDYMYTPGTFTPYESRQQYEMQSAWLRNKIEANKDKKIVVFTHHQPFEELVLSDYKHSNVNEAYVVLDHSLDDINKNNNIVLWCCGHTHQNFDGMLHNVHVVRNPIGYSDIYGMIPAENIKSGSWYNKIIEI